MERAGRYFITQTELAQRLGRPQSFVAKNEGGERRINVIEFLAINNALQQDAVEALKQLVRAIR